MLADKRPKLLITDGLPAYHQAYVKEYETNSIATTTHHIRKITLTGDQNNKKMERFNGEIRDREKVMRSLKRADTPILTGLGIFRNYVRPNGGLDGCTPSEMAGIEVQGDNRWLTLIQNAASKEMEKHK